MEKIVEFLNTNKGLLSLSLFVLGWTIKIFDTKITKSIKSINYWIEKSEDSSFIYIWNASNKLITNQDFTKKSKIQIISKNLDSKQIEISELTNSYSNAKVTTKTNGTVYLQFDFLNPYEGIKLKTKSIKEITIKGCIVGGNEVKPSNLKFWKGLNMTIQISTAFAIFYSVLIIMSYFDRKYDWDTSYGGDQTWIVFLFMYTVYPMCVYFGFTSYRRIKKYYRLI